MSADILDAIPDSLYRLTSQGEVIPLNDGLQRITGEASLRKGLSVGPEAWLEVIHPEDREAWQRAYADPAEAEPDDNDATLLYRLKGEQGCWRWMESRRQPEWGADGAFGGYVCADRDCTDRYQTQQQVERKAKYYESILNADGAYIVRTDAEGRYTYVSQSFVNTFRFQREKVLGTDSLQDIHPDDQPKTYDTVYRCFAEPGKAHKIELRKPRPGGGHFYTLWEFVGIVNEWGEVAEIQCVGIDRTELRDKEQALKAADTDYRLLFNGIQEVVAVLTPNGRVLRISPAIETVLGCTPEEIVGLDMYALAHPGDVTLLEHNFQRAMAGEQVCTIARFRHKKGGYVWLEWVTSTAFDQDGRPEKVLSAGRDVTQQLLQKQQLELRRYQLEKAHQLARLGYFEYDPTSEFISLSEETAAILQLNTAGSQPIDRLKKVLADSEYNTMLQALRRAAASVEEQRMEWTMADGTSIRSVLKRQDGQGSEVVGVLQDITEQKQREALLWQQKQELELMFHNSLYGFVFLALDEPVDWHGATDKDALLEYVLDHQRVARANQTLLELYGYREREILGQTPALFFDETTDDLRSAWHQLLERGYYRGEWQRHRKDGSRIWVQAEYVALYNDDGKVTGHLGIQRDVSQRRKAQESEKEALALLRKLTDQVPGVLYQYKLDDDNQQEVPFASEAVYDVLGVSKEEIETQGVSAFRYIHPEDREQVRFSIEKSRQTLDVWSLDFRVQHPTHGVIWVRGMAKPERQWGSVLWHGYLTDITQRRLRHQELIKTKKRLQRLTEQAPGALYEFQMTPEGEMRFLYVSSGISKISPYLSPELLLRDAERAFELIHPSDRGYVEGRIRQSFRQLSYFDVEYRVHAAGHQYHWHRATARPERQGDGSVVWYGIFQDITEQKETQRQFERLALVAESTNDVVLICDDKGIITWVNHSVKSMLGFEPEEVMGLLPTNRLIGPKTNANDVQRLLNALDPPRDYVDKLLLYTKDGRTLWIDYHVNPVYDHSGNYIYTVVIKRDITGLIEKQEKLQELLDINADQTQRLQNFTHIVSHNIRSHSANLSALLELMESSPSSSEQQDYLPHLKKTTDRLEETIQNLNEVISINNHLNQAKQKLPLRVEIEKILELLQPQIQEAQASIQLRVAEDLHVLAVPAYLESILQNLISNALKYRALHRQAFVEIQAFETKTGVWVYVQDNGLGIDLKSNRDKIFGMYKTFHTNEDARGLGLFITKNQVEAMGGRIDVESVPGIGTTFKVMFADD